MKSVGVRAGASAGPVRVAFRVALLAAAMFAGGCAQFPQEPLIHQPMTTRGDPQPPVRARNLSGAIYQDGGRGNALFEDRRPRRTGDILTIVVSERVNASKNSAASASRSDSISAAFTGIPKVLGGLFTGQDTALTGANNLTSKGGANAANTFNGVITVTVVDVLNNGNLLVSGEKQMLINQGTEFIRFSGIVNPRTVTGDNTVSSTLVADARIEYSAKGYINEAQTMGWLQRVFLNVMPF